MRGRDGLTRPSGSAALDLGSARTRVLLCGDTVIVDQPSAVVTLDQPALVRSVAGDSAAGGPSLQPAGKLWPVRHGMVSDGVACARLVRRVLSSRTPYECWPLERVVLGVPVTASTLDRRAASSAVSNAAGCPVVIVEEPLAAAIGCGLDVTDSRPRLLLDVGAGIIEAVLIRDSKISDAGAVQITADARADEPEHVRDRVSAMVADLIARIPQPLRRSAREGGLLLTGGGASRPELARQLCAELRIAVSPAVEPANATIRGLARLCLPPLSALVTAQTR